MWFHQGFPFDSNLIDQEGYVGFVYLITNKVTQRKYIGKKLFKFTRRKKIKGKIFRKKIVQESDWVEYFGSSQSLLDDIDVLGKENFDREILYLCKRKGECNYYEAYEQMVRHAILNDDYYNDTIRVTVHRVHLGIGTFRKNGKKKNL